MERKAIALHWYVETLKAHKSQTIKAVMASFVSALLLDAAIPYCMVLIFDQFENPSRSLQELFKPISLLVLCLLLFCGVAPYRLWSRWRLEASGYEYLTDKMNRAIKDTPDIASKLKPGAATGSAEKFLDTWATFLFTATEQLIMFVVGICSLVLLLSVRAPIALVIVAVVIVVVLAVVRKVAERLGEAYDKRSRADVGVLGVFDGLFNSAPMQWLVETLTDVREVVTARRTEVALGYARVVAVFYFFMYGIGTFLKVIAVAGGAVMVVQGTISVGTVVLLLVYAFSLSERLYGIFGIGEIFGTAAVESRPLLVALDGSQPKPPLPSSEHHIVEFKGVVVEYVVTPPATEKDEAAASPRETKVRVALSDVTLVPGITLFMGPNGCGKSTRFKVLAGCQSHSEGLVSIGGYDMTKFDVRGSVFYGRQNFDELAVSVEELFRGADEKVIRRALARVSYEDVSLTRLLSEFSGGQRRRIFLARLLHSVFIRDKSTLGVLCLDEPTNDLDEGAVKRFLEELVKVAQEDPLLIVSIATHHREMKEIATQVIET